MKALVFSMRNLTLAVVTTVLTFFAGAACLAEEIDYDKGFRSVEWGASLSDFGDKMKKSKNKVRPFKGYDLAGDDMSWEGITATGITYGFTKKQKTFGGLNIGFSTGDADAVIATFTKRYGEPKRTDLVFMVNYEWHTGVLDISPVTTSKGGSFNVMPKR